MTNPNYLRFMHNQVEAEAYLAAIIASSDDAIISKDLKGNITSWNISAERIFGYTSKEAVGKHISLIIPPEFLSEEDYILSKIKQGERVDHFEATLRAKDGKYVNLSITVSPIRNKDGKIIGASKIARNVTAVKEAEHTGAYLSAIIDSSDDAIISKDLSGFITSWNISAERIFGFTTEEAVGKHITLIIPAEQLDEEEKILTTLKTGERIDHYETIRKHKDGHLIPISLTVSPIRDRFGKIVGASKVSRDISERVSAEKLIKEMSVKKDEFLANMSHELRTPMNAVIGLANLLNVSPNLSERDTKCVKTLKISADNLMELINDLLDFAKLESGSIQLEELEFDLAQQVEKVISVMSVKAHEKALDLNVNVPATLNRYYIGDSLRLQQIITNLVSNAVKFTDQGSVDIDISGKVNKKSDITTLVIKVSDTGIGIAMDKQEAIFEKFTQADASMTRKFGGTGLGLAITKALIQRMGGTIDVKSNIGIGSIFTVSIPFKNATRFSSMHISMDNKITSLPTNKNVLLVEDYEPNIFVTSMILDQLGYDYDVANNGLEALKKLSSGKYDIILMDVQMPELDGLESTRRIRQMEKERGLEQTPVIAMTAHVREQDKDQCLGAGMNDFIPKPFDPAVLSQKLARHIQLKQTG